MPAGVQAFGRREGVLMREKRLLYLGYTCMSHAEAGPVATRKGHLYRKCDLLGRKARLIHVRCKRFFHHGQFMYK